MPSKLIFLGTGGGRHTTMFQARSTGGFLLNARDSWVHVDPGPGALVNMMRIGYNLEGTNGIVISHCHPDHYSDAEVAIEGMSRGGWVRNGELYGTKSVLEGSGGLGPCISKYHQGLASGRHLVKAGDRRMICGIPAEITKTDHSDPCNVGFRFDTGDGIVSYVSDTSYSEEIAGQHKGSRILLLPVTTPSGNRIKYHLCTDDAYEFIDIVKPELAVFVHMGIVMLRRDADAQAREVEEATGIRTIAGRDLMTLDLEEKVRMDSAPLRDGSWNPVWNI